jgi:crAss001_48 related protein
MEVHQQRVVDELKELETRRVRLGTFIRENDTFKKLPQPEQDRMMKQYDIMLKYEEILSERIAAF